MAIAVAMRFGVAVCSTRWRRNNIRRIMGNAAIPGIRVRMLIRRTVSSSQGSRNIFHIIEYVFDSLRGLIYFLHIQYLPHYRLGISGSCRTPVSPSLSLLQQILLVCCKDILSTFFVQVNMYIVVLGHFFVFLTHFADGHQMDNCPGMAQLQGGSQSKNCWTFHAKVPFSFNNPTVLVPGTYRIGSICFSGRIVYKKAWTDRNQYVVQNHTILKTPESENAVCWT